MATMNRDMLDHIPRKLHLIVTGEEGRSWTFVIPRGRVPQIVGTVLALLVVLGMGTWKGIGYLAERSALTADVAELSSQVRELNESFDSRLEASIAAREAAWQARFDAMTASLEAQHQALETLWEEKAELTGLYEATLAARAEKHDIQITAIRSEYEQQISELQRDKQELLETMVTRLDERSRIIENMMSHIGVEVKVNSTDTVANSGGPFIAIDEEYGKRLLDRSDRYIATVKKTPLGYPVHGRITSGFGRRRDPFNNRVAFHAGIDFRGRIGEKVEATADGVVAESGYNRSLGHYVTIRHGNGYSTVFAHLSKRLVKKGERITRGQVIGLMGNSGRSTGPHLHYEVRYKGKPVNPRKYLSVAGLSFTVPE